VARVVIRLRLGLALVCFASVAQAGGELDAAAGPAVGASGGNDWSGDGAIPYATLRLAYRHDDLIGPVFVGREGYASTDERLLTLIGFGAQIWARVGETRPYARLVWLHQHEESVAFAKEEPLGVLFGVGKGIRHRGGMGAALGLDLPFAKGKRWSGFVAGEIFCDWFFASEAPGPAWYAGGALLVGFDYRLF
jgi:hypothetical protein